MSGKLSRTKGHNFERQLVRMFKEAGIPSKRGIQYKDGADYSDVVTNNIWVEAKIGKMPNPRAALKQASASLKQASEAYNRNKIPVAIIKDDRKAPFVTLWLSDFLGIIGPWMKDQE